MVSDFHQVNSVFVYLHAAQAATEFYLPLQIIDPVVHLNRELLGIPVAVDLDIIVRRGLIESFRNFLEVIVIAHTFDHLLRGHERQVLGDGAESGMSHQKDLSVVGVVGALAEFTVQLPELLFIQMGCVQGGPGHQFKFPGSAHAVAGIQPQPSLVVALQHQYILPVPDGEKEVQHFRIFQTPVHIISHKYIEFVLPDAAVFREIFLQDGAAAVNIPDVMDSVVGRQVDSLKPDGIQLIGLYHLYPGGDFLGGKAGIHSVDHFLGYSLQRLPVQIPPLHFGNGDVGKIHAVHPIPIGLAHLLVAVEFRGLGVGGVDYREFAVLHADFQQAEKHFPHRFVVALADPHRAVHLHDRPLTEQTDFVCAQSISF